MKPFHVIYEDNHLIIVNKAPGILVHGDSTGDKTLEEYVKEYIRDKYNKPGEAFLGTVHRLDRPVSGVVIFARTSKALTRMSELFRKRQIQKTYWAVTQRMPEKKSGRLTHWLKKDPVANKTEAFTYETEGAQRADLDYRYLGTVNKHHLLEVSPITGRPHQIRVQLASMGTPIKGDVKYGAPKGNADGSIFLHARRVYFIHPVKKEPLICKAPLPPNAFWEEFLELDKEEYKDDMLGYLH